MDFRISGGASGAQFIQLFFAGKEKQVAAVEADAGPFSANVQIFVLEDARLPVWKPCRIVERSKLGFDAELFAAADGTLHCEQDSRQRTKGERSQRPSYRTAARSSFFAALLNAARRDFSSHSRCMYVAK